MTFEQIFILALLLFVGFFGGLIAMWIYHRLKLGRIENLGNELLQKAELQAEIIKKNSDLLLKQRQMELEKNQEERSLHERKKILQEEDRLKLREDKLERRLNLVEKKLSDIDKREAILQARRTQLDEDKRAVTETKLKLETELERLSGMNKGQVKEELICRVQDEIKCDCTKMARDLKIECERESERIAQTILATAINRLSVSTVSDTTTMTVTIPHEELKGRIIGKDGRNIRILERLTGVNFLLDETPGIVVISGFDPLRKFIAKIALNDLVTDGRIQPTRIEEAVDRAKITAQKQIRQFGEDAALRTGVMHLHPELIQLLGKLKLRFSYGQNVLEHSMEVAHLMGMMATELKANVPLARRIGLLHDVGKAISHEVEGTHALIGYDLALKFGETKEVANGIGCHHEEMEPITVEGSLSGPADRISAARPGARIEAVEEYFKRLKKLEDLAYEFPGIEQAYAMQAGREVRIVVMPEMIDDQGIANLARDLSRRIEAEIQYPGKIKVTVIREKRAVVYAL